MATTYQWIRHITSPTPFGGVPTAVANPYGVYLSDHSFGIRTLINPRPNGSGGITEYMWRLRVYRDTNRLIDQEWRYRPNGGSPLLDVRTYDSAGNPGSFINQTAALGGMPAGLLVLDSLFLASSLSGASAAVVEDIVCGTTTAQFQYKENGSIVAGGIGTGGGSLGIGGFDIRTLAIKNLRAEKPVTNLSSKENTVNILGDVHALPGYTSLFPAGWEPTSSVDFVVQVGDLGATDLYHQVVGTLPTSAPTSTGKVASLTLPAADRWKGLDSSGNIIDGLSLVVAQASAYNADGATISTSREKYSNALTYQCPSCSNGGMTMSCPIETTTSPPSGMSLESALSYTAFDYGQLPASLGYGWSSQASMSVEDLGSELVFKSAGGGYARWIDNSGSYVPFSPGNYTEAEKDMASTTARYKLTFKDQMVCEFDISGKLQRKVDRNGNALSYSYNGTTGLLESISDGNGRSHHYTNRSDGQLLTLRVNNATTGRLTQFVYYSSSHPDSPDRLQKIVDPEGNETQFEYYTNGPLRTIIDPQGNVATVLEYDSFARLFRETTYGEVRRTHFYGTTDSSHEILEEDLVGSEPDRSRYMEFDKIGNTIRMLELVEPDPIPANSVINETLMEYNDPTVAPFIPNPYLLTRRIDPNLTESVMTYTSNGNVKTVTDKDGNVTTYTYAEEIDVPLNPKHRNRIRRIQRPAVTVAGVSTTYAPTVLNYDANGNPERITDAAGVDAYMTYATDGLVLTVTNRRGDTTEFVYQGAPFNGESRNLLQVKTPKGNSSSDGFRTVDFEYSDGYDNVTLVRDGGGNETNTTFDNLDRPQNTTNPLNEVTQFHYVNTLLDEVVMPPNNGSATLDRRTTMVYDTSNRLEEVRRDINSGGTQQMRVSYSYTGFSQMAALTRIKNGSARSFTFDFDRLGRQVSVADSLPTPGVSTAAFEPFCVGHAATSARGIRRKISFDNRCLPTQLEAGDVDLTDPLEVANVREVRQWQHDELGRMVKSSQSQASVYGPPTVFGLDSYGNFPEERIYRYNELDRLLEMRFRTNGDPLGANDKMISWEYDNEGNVTKMVDTEGKITRYAYYRDHLLKEVRIERSGQSDRVFTYSYDLAGRLLQIVYPSGTGVVAKFDDGTSTPGSGWDAKGQLLHLRYEKSGALIRRLQFAYDESGNRASLLDVTDGTVLTAKAIKWEFFYDWLDRLVTVNRSEAANVGSLPGTIAPFSAYTYDASDNRLTYRDEVADKTYRYAMDEADNLIGVYLTDGSDPEILIESSLPDADGNMLTRTNEITDEVITYGWNDFDRLIRVSSADSGGPTTTVKENNRYDINGIRKRKLDKNGSGSHEYTAGISTVASKAVSSSSSAPTISYLQGHQILGAEVNGVWQYWLGDALGSTREVVDDTGLVIRSMEFAEHGQLLNSSGTGTFAPKTYQGALSVNDDTADSGLYMMGHRHFESGRLGRFISRDPIGFSGGLNLFSGHGTSPVTFVDPWGAVPRKLNDYEQMVFDRALGLINRLGGKWSKMAQELKELDCQGKINVDNDKVRSRNLAERLAGVPNGASAMTADDRISFHSETIPTPSLGGGRFGSGAASKSEQLGIAYILASNLVHELKHWRAGHAHGTKTTEAGMYEFEREFGIASLAFEMDAMLGQIQKGQAPSSGRCDEIKFRARSREDEGVGGGFMPPGPTRF